MLRIIFHPVILIIFTLVSIFFSFSLYQSAQKTKISSESLQLLQQEIENAKAEQEKLELALRESESSVTKERIIRDELLMKRPGEYVIQLPDIPEQGKLSASAESSADSWYSSSIWKEWQQILF